MSEVSLIYKFRLGRHTVIMNTCIRDAFGRSVVYVAVSAYLYCPVAPFSMSLEHVSRSDDT